MLKELFESEDWMFRCYLLIVLSVGLLAQDAAGNWKGAIAIPNGELEIFVTLKAGDSWSGTIDIPVQGLRDFNLTNVSVKGDQVTFDMPGVPGEPHFQGTQMEGKITGTFTQGPQSLNFHLNRSDERPPEPANAELPKSPIPGQGAIGNWLGVLQAGPVKLRLGLKIEKNESGLNGVMDSIDQNTKLVMDIVAFADGQFSFAINQVQGHYKGKMNADGSAIEGTWTQMGNSASLVFHRLAKTAK